MGQLDQIQLELFYYAKVRKVAKTEKSVCSQHDIMIKLILIDVMYTSFLTAKRTVVIPRPRRISLCNDYDWSDILGCNVRTARPLIIFGILEIFKKLFWNTRNCHNLNVEDGESSPLLTHLVSVARTVTIAMVEYFLLILLYVNYVNILRATHLGA
ncbi:hypothetical protein BGW36DRAFT_404329 [Talaromyces proteolyticus]|uniref:Uncharacterized protein n=1 Tax=Talaromyces proteolyticus TaxID=1131652 RepID=A0AAD4KYX5_9EURO|nr:uncharacterized protein BGW36DRAFT_404329 [Talaromyces proteolyticus]KAH8704095.1 hypothetical protein BGW36DRAFT_404329 [Talaromyces proteolyticus]